MVTRKKVFRIAGKVLLGLLILAIVGFVVMLHVMFGRYDENKTVEKIRQAQIPIEQHFVEVDDKQLNVYQIGDPALPKMLLIHGSPGHWVDWVNVLTSKEVTQQYCMIALDRPGYGLTNFPALSSLSDQAEIAAKAIHSVIGDQETYGVAGHSYGGGVVQQMLVDFPKRVNRGIYVAGTLFPKVQRPKWYNYVAFPFTWVLPRGFRSSNREMMGLAQSLELLAPKQAQIEQPVVMIHGTKDVLVPYKTVDYIKQMQPAGVRYMIRPEMNHFIPWSDPDLIISAILAEF